MTDTTLSRFKRIPPTHKPKRVARTSRLELQEEEEPAYSLDDGEIVKYKRNA
jgi:hypothetical protein